MTVLGIVALAQAALVPSGQQAVDSLRVTADSLRRTLGQGYVFTADSIRRALDRDYTRLLEGVNNQHSAWLTPYGFAIAWLAAVMTLGGIAVAFVLYRQSADHQRKLNEQLTGFSTLMGAKVSEADKIVADLTGLLQENQKQAEEMKGSLQTVLNTPEAAVKERLQDLLDFYIRQTDATTSKIDGVIARATGTMTPDWSTYPVFYMIEVADDPQIATKILEAMRLLPGITLDYPEYRKAGDRHVVRAFSRRPMAGNAVKHLFEDAGLSVKSMTIGQNNSALASQHWP